MKPYSGNQPPVPQPGQAGTRKIWDLENKRAKNEKKGHSNEILTGILHCVDF
jgi:hypothetical protein